MKQIVITISSLFFILLSASAQKEIYFNTTKPEDIKVSSMQGIEIGSGISTLSSLFNKNIVIIKNKSFSFPLNISYFNEKRIAPTWTLTTRIGLDQSFSNLAQYVAGKDSSIYNDSIYYNDSYKINGYKFEYKLQLNLGIEPRWYLGFRNRFQKGKAKFNSGWYLSFPLLFSTTLIDTSKSPTADLYSAFKTYGTFQFIPAMGYRQAISKQWFLEGDFQLFNLSSQLYTYNNKLKIEQPRITLFPRITLKAAYTFN